MFSNNEKKTTPETDTVIGGSTKIYGNIHFSHKLHIDGEIAGNIVAETEGSILTISERGKIKGNVQVHRIELNGEVVGDVYAINDIELAPNARVRGNVYYNKIEMAKGAEVNGNMIHGKPQSTEAEPAPANDASHTTPATHVVGQATAPVDKVVASATTADNPTEPGQTNNTKMQPIKKAG